MDLAKQIRLNRIFANPSGNLCSVAVDHFVGYQKGLPEGLINVPQTIDKVMEARPDAITMMKGMAKSAWWNYAGRIPLIVSSVSFTPDDAIAQILATPDEVARMGADAIAVAIGVRGPNEGMYLKFLTQQVERADRLGLPVIAHIYPRAYTGAPTIVHDPENIMWALRCGIECGADIVKIPFTGDVASYRDIIATSPVPVVAAGGPRCETLREALEMMGKVMEAGARGGTIGRNIWGHSDPTRAVWAFKGVIHEGITVDEALERAEEAVRLGFA